MAAIILQESNGNTNAEGDSDQKTRTNRYNAIKGDFKNNQNYQEYYKALKEKGIVKTEEDFFILVSKYSYGLFQISPQTAALRGFRDNPEKLKDARINIEIAIKELIAKGFNSEDKGIEGLTKAAQIINRGKQGLTPHEGYIESVKTFFEQLEKESDLNNKGIHCKKGSTVCFIETDDVEKSKMDLYEEFSKILTKRNIKIPSISDFFVEEEFTNYGVRLKTEYNFNPDEVELLYSSNFFVLTDDYSDDLFTLTRKGKISTTATHRLTPKNFASIFSHEYKKGLTGAKSLAYKDYFGNIIVLFWKTGEGSRGIEFHHRDALAYLIKEEADKIEKFAYLTNSLDLLSESDDLNKLFKMISTIRRQDQFPESILERSIGFQLTVDSRGKIKFFDVDSSITSAQINAIDNNELSFDSVMFAEMLGKVNSLIDPSLRNYNGKVRVKSLSVFSKSSNVDVSKYALRLVDLH